MVEGSSRQIPSPKKHILLRDPPTSLRLVPLPVPGRYWIAKPSTAHGTAALRKVSSHPTRRSISMALVSTPLTIG